MTAVESKREITVRVQPLTAEAFAPYGRVVNEEREGLQMQEGQFTARLMTVRRVPETMDRINRHMDHSQMFVPLSGDRTVLVVAPPSLPMAGFDATQIAAFATDGKTTVIFHPGTWHIEPRALGKDSCQVINVQTDVFRQHTELLHLEEDCGVRVKLQV
ncbi:MAG: ureidoglycolate lyase [Chloroflexota bacterium]